MVDGWLGMGVGWRGVGVDVRAVLVKKEGLWRGFWGRFLICAEFGLESNDYDLVLLSG
ncbi:unnamed protein product [Moneuplotes crassus]|uniref:Uncharacterized protein n=1 Tax=Euplotes crassus TaxID=5936 RepID=A0AAD1XDE7_EUPCR|nr:unnamed protein product [Moneuplotes crassus]